MSKLGYWVADWNLSRAEAARLLGGNVYDMVDIVEANVDKLAPHFLAMEARSVKFAGYVTGTPDIRWSAASISQIRPGDLLKIDQSTENLPLDADIRLVKDVEPGASGADLAAEVAKERLHANRNYIIYVDRSGLPTVEAAVERQGLPPGEIVAYQYASPSSNPETVVPGTWAKLSEIACDLSVINKTWLPAPVEMDIRSPAHNHSLARAWVGNGSGTVQLDLRDMTWKVESGDISVKPMPWGD